MTTPAIALLDAHGAVIRWTRAAEDLLGHRTGDVLRRRGVDLLMPGDRAAQVSTWARGYAHQDHWSGLVEARHRDGRPLLLRLDAWRLDLRDGGTAWLLSATPAHAGQPEGQVLEPFFGPSRAALSLWDDDLRCVGRNETARRLRATLVPGRATGSLEEVVPAGALRQVLSDGSALVAKEFSRPSADEREGRTFSVSIFRLDGEDGRSPVVCSLVHDITHTTARRRLSLLLEAGVRIGATLDVSKTAQELADLAVPVLADYVTVDLAESVLPDDEPLRRLAASDTSIPVFRRAGKASSHPGRRESLWELGDAVFVPPLSPFVKVMSSRASYFEPALDASPGTWLDADPDRAEIIHSTGVHSLIIVPLLARGDILGIVVFVRTDDSEPFGMDDLMLAEGLAARAALSIDNARRYTREHTAALALQRHLLPRALCGGGTLEVAASYRPSDIHAGVGGDWYDVIPLPNGHLALVIGDVTGHGLSAAAMMGRLRTVVRTLAHLGLPPDEVLTHLDHVIAHMIEEESAADGSGPDVMAATCLYAVYDPASRHCTMASAGHPPPAIVDPAGEVTFPRLPTGTPIGLGLCSYRSRDLYLAEGSLIVLYTDGLIESRTDDLEAGMGRLGDILARTTRLAPDLCTAVLDALTGESFEDDVAVLIARTLG
ncbi:SpoIIE family protein phosphatase [Streptosporangium sp. H16]|uniref:SpoIIE family protein phosphatase n=1 Tax=Streptosporangium sp. H16 TaxID=3444184 RepID=UPI003F79312D